MIEIRSVIYLLMFPRRHALRMGPERLKQIITRV